MASSIESARNRHGLISRAFPLVAGLFAGALLRAAPAGSSHPASGPYSPVDPAGWGSAAWPLGATFTAGPGSTLEIGVYSANATEVVLEIYLADTGADAAYDYTMVKGPDNVWRAAVAQAPQYTLYAFRAWGPNWPFSAAWTRGNSSAGYIADCDSLGNRFNPNKVLFDPYARELSHNTYTPAMAAAGESYSIYASGGADVSASQTYQGPLSPNAPIDCRAVDDGHWAPKAVAFEDDTPTGTKPDLAQKDAIIYETHLKGLTAHPSSVNLATLLSPYSGFQDAADVPDDLRGTYAGAAYMAGYLKDLGFNTVEFLPVQETDNATDSTTAPTTSGGGYWAYFTYGYFAPDRRYASNQALGGPTAEFKAMVAAFHRAGMEVYLDVVYNHTGEGGVWDASTAAQAELTFLRGLDNRSYYTLVPGSPKYYWVSTGVGNNLNGGSAPVQQLILDSLTYWSQTMGVDGFRFDEAAELGRNGPSEFSGTAPLLVAIANLAQADGFKVIAEPWDENDGGEIGNFPPGWACWNGNYRDSIRMYLTGDVTGWVDGAGDLSYADAFAGDEAKMAGEGGPEKSVNYIDSHDGFTMTDLVSYGTPPSTGALQWPFGPEQDGGADYSSSWGGDPTLRRQAIRDFWTYQVLSRGVPMMVWGDEFGRTVNGNNNAYNIDSVATWNNYNMIAANSPDAIPTGDLTGGTMGYANNLGTFAGGLNENFIFLQYLLHLRAAHPAFRQQDFTSEAITFANSDGTANFSPTASQSFQAYVHGSQVGDADFLVLSNVSPTSVDCAIPPPPAGTQWGKIIDTDSAYEAGANCWAPYIGPAVGANCPVANQSLVVLEALANSASRVANISTRADVLGGSNAEIVGFYVGGPPGSTKQLLIRAVGPGLEAFGVPGTLSAPQLVLNDSAGIPVATDAGWGNPPLPGTSAAPVSYRAATAVDFASVGAFPLAQGSADCALVITVPPGGYTATLSGAAGATGIALGELYEMNPSDAATLENLSTRAYVGPQPSQAAVAGFIVGGSQPVEVLLRGIGPALSEFGVPATLPDPSLTVYDQSGNVIVGDAGWCNAPVLGASPLVTGSAPAAAARPATSDDFAATGAFALASGSPDCAVVLALPPGAYTAQVTSAAGAAGTALVEVYRMR